MKNIARYLMQMGIQLSIVEIIAICKAVEARSRTNLLVFGLCHDSIFWHSFNESGRTIFIEDNWAWFSMITNRHKILSACLVTYGGVRDEAFTLLSSHAPIHFNLLRAIESVHWDVIVVDGPAGYAPNQPGRLKCICEP